MEEMNNIYEAEVNEVYDLVPIETEEAEEKAGMSTGLAIAIGTLGGIALVKLGEKVIDGGKKLIAKRKAKKAEAAAAAAKEAESAPADAPAVEEPVPEEA